MHAIDFFFQMVLKDIYVVPFFLCTAGINYRDTSVLYVFERCASLEMMRTKINHILFNNLPFIQFF